jgi:16S rRNA (uracil1498-N3)-methyltransferase
MRTLPRMNLILLFPEEIAADGRVRLEGRRFEHVSRVIRPVEGGTLTVGVAGGQVGRGEVLRVEQQAIELRVVLETDPPRPRPLTLVLAVPRPKVLNRVVAAAASLGVARIFLVNAWKVEKSYWSSPRMSPENLRAQSILGLEQARDTALPVIETRRLFRPFAEDELPAIVGSGLAIVPHPGASEACPRDVRQPVTLAIGPEGGFIEQEIASLVRAGFRPVSLGERILRVETAIAAAIGRLF